MILVRSDLLAGGFGLGFEFLDLGNTPDQCRKNDNDQGVISVITVQLGGDGGKTEQGDREADCDRDAGNNDAVTEL